MLSIVVQSVGLASIIEEVAIETLKHPPSIGKIRAVAKAVFGVSQVILGTVVFPFQICGRIFKHNKPLVFVQGLKSLKMVPFKVHGISRAIFGFLHVLFGIFLCPFQLCGRVFKSTQPLLVREGVKTIFRGISNLQKCR